MQRALKSKPEIHMFTPHKRKTCIVSARDALYCTRMVRGAHLPIAFPVRKQNNECDYLLTRHGQFERLYVCTYGTCKLPKGYNSTVFILSELTCNKEEFTFSVYQRILW